MELRILASRRSERANERKQSSCCYYANIDYEKRIIESFSYNTSVYYAMYKDHLYLVNGEGNNRETALHGTLVYIVTIYDVITKTARVLCWTYSCMYCIVYICGEWVIYAEPVTYVR